MGAYPWSWGRKGVPYYCCHCYLMHDIIPIEIRGSPCESLIRENGKDPCIYYYYKKPELIPEEFFTRIGVKKPK